MAISDVVIVGGGIIGLSCADALARQGVIVTVVDAKKPGQASWAAAGMLAPLAESGSPGPFLDLGVQSLRRWPEFAAHLQESSGIAVPIVGPGILRVARTEDEEQALCRAWGWQEATGLPLERLDGARLHSLEPGLSQDIHMAVLSSSEQHVEPRLVLQALEGACLKRGVRRTAQEVIGFRQSGDQIQYVITPAGDIPCGQVLIAGGAWSNTIGAYLGSSLPVAPLRGQILALGPCMPSSLQHTIYTHDAYLVPRQDGRIVVGATEEQVGFETQTTARGINGLLSAAQEIYPALANLSLDSTWTGLRPVSPDGLPILGRIPGWANAHIAAGHGRNGILLTPVTADLIAAAILEDSSLPSAFHPTRFLGAK